MMQEATKKIKVNVIAWSERCFAALSVTARIDIVPDSAQSI
jgi:hypothetical protein